MASLHSAIRRRNPAVETSIESEGSRPTAGRWAGVIVIAALLSFGQPTDLHAAHYRCHVTVIRQGVPPVTLYDGEVEVDPFWFWQTPEGMARNQVLSGDLRNQATGTQTSVYCWEIQKPKLWGIIPVSYTYGSDDMKGITLVYSVPIEDDGDSVELVDGADGGQGVSALDRGAAMARRRVRGDFDLSAVGEIGITKANASSAIILAGGARLGKPVTVGGLEAFGQLMGGVTHFPGENAITIKPEVGVIVPLVGQSFSATMQVGMPTIFFSGNRERGWEVGIGVVLPGRRSTSPPP